MDKDTLGRYRLLERLGRRRAEQRRQKGGSKEEFRCGQFVWS
jgi:hypothetical protein